MSAVWLGVNNSEPKLERDQELHFFEGCRLTPSILKTQVTLQLHRVCTKHAAVFLCDWAEEVIEDQASHSPCFCLKNLITEPSAQSLHGQINTGLLFAQ